MSPEVILIPGGIALVLGLTGLAFGRLGWRVAGIVVAALCWITAILLFLVARTQTGWDALGWFIGSVMMALPAAVGMSLGLWIGLRFARRRGDP